MANSKRGPKPKKAAPSKKPKPAQFVAPDRLSSDERIVFARMVRKLKAAGVLDRTDPELIELNAINFVMLHEARKAIQEDGIRTKTRFGSMAANPMLDVINKTTIRLKAILNDLGLTPASSKLAASPKDSGGKTEDPWEGLLNVIG